MIVTISLIVAFLVILNFALLIFSCNKITKVETSKINSVKQQFTLTTRQLESHQLVAAAN